jgi:hypothetical protein
MISSLSSEAIMAEVRAAVVEIDTAEDQLGMDSMLSEETSKEAVKDVMLGTLLMPEEEAITVNNLAVLNNLMAVEAVRMAGTAMGPTRQEVEDQTLEDMEATAAAPAVVNRAITRVMVDEEEKIEIEEVAHRTGHTEELVEAAMKVDDHHHLSTLNHRISVHLRIHRTADTTLIKAAVTDRMVELVTTHLQQPARLTEDTDRRDMALLLQLHLLLVVHPALMALAMEVTELLHHLHMARLPLHHLTEGHHHLHYQARMVHLQLHIVLFSLHTQLSTGHMAAAAMEVHLKDTIHPLQRGTYHLHQVCQPTHLQEPATVVHPHRLAEAMESMVVIRMAHPLPLLKQPIEVTYLII